MARAVVAEDTWRLGLFGELGLFDDSRQAGHFGQDEGSRDAAAFTRELAKLIHSALAQVEAREPEQLLDVEVDAYYLGSAEPPVSGEPTESAQPPASDEPSRTRINANDPNAAVSIWANPAANTVANTVAIRLTTTTGAQVGIAATTLASPLPGEAALGPVPADAAPASPTPSAPTASVPITPAAPPAKPTPASPSAATQAVLAAVAAAPVMAVPDLPPSGPTVGQWARRAASSYKSFATIGAPWARKHNHLATLTVGGNTVAEYVDGAAMSPLDSPRPHLHPVRTLGGVAVSDAEPADHSWHVGVAMGVQDVAGANLWGGRTFLDARGSTWRADHGWISHEEFTTSTSDSLVEELTWYGPRGAVLLTEQRELRALPALPGGPASMAGWELHFTTTLTNPAKHAVELGSAGTHGKVGGGYGGFFWRLPAMVQLQVATSHAEGEAGCHGQISSYLGVTGLTGEGYFALICAEDPASGHTGDPWFIRTEGYPGFGSSLAWEFPVSIPAGGTLTRGWRTLVLDGRYSIADLREIAAAWLDGTERPTPTLR